MFELVNDVFQVDRVSFLEEAGVEYVCRNCGRVFLQIGAVVEICLNRQKHGDEKDCDGKDFFHIFINKFLEWNIENDS